MNSKNEQLPLFETEQASRLKFNPLTGLTDGYTAPDLPLARPDVSQSPYHQPRVLGVNRFVTQANIDNELSGPSTLEERQRLISESLDSTIEAAAPPDPAEVRPVLLGLRKAVAEKQLKRNKKKAAKLEEPKLVAEHVLKSTQEGENYITPLDPLRPKGFRQKVRAWRIQRTTEHLQRFGAKKHYMGASFGPDVVRGDFNDRMKRRPLSLFETISSRKINLSARGSSGMHSLTYNWRERIVEKPAKRQQKSIERSGELQAKLNALDEAESRSSR